MNLPGTDIALDTINYQDFKDWMEIGKGSFGLVYRADYLGTDVAIKQCFDIFENRDFDFEKYYKREVILLNEARHPNIVQFMGTYVLDKKVFIVTEYVPGGCLKNWIIAENSKFKKSLRTENSEKNEILSFRVRISFATDISRAISYLHARGIIHRDLKPENLLITENNRIKVCDFGFSRSIARTEIEKKKLSFCGTEGYMAPELILCMENYTISVDVFSFGIILISLLILEIPTGDGPNDIPPFARAIPGFGLDSEQVEKSLNILVPHKDKLLQLILKCVHEDMDKRAHDKEIMSTLKDCELEIITKIKELDLKTGKKSIINVGIAPEQIHESTELLPLFKIPPPPTSAPPSDHTYAFTLNSFRNSQGSMDSIAENEPRARAKYRSEVVEVSISSENSSKHLSSQIPHAKKSFSSPGLKASNVVLSESKNSLHDTRGSLQNIFHTPISGNIIQIKKNILHGSSESLRTGHEIPHRFSVVFHSLALHNIKCEVCGKGMFGFMHSHMECDDCGYKCHKRCSTMAPMNCGLPGQLNSILNNLKITDKKIKDEVKSTKSLKHSDIPNNPNDFSSKLTKGMSFS